MSQDRGGGSWLQRSVVSFIIETWPNIHMAPCSRKTVINMSFCRNPKRPIKLEGFFDVSLKIIRLLWLLSGKEHATVTCYLSKEMQRKDVQTINVTLNVRVRVCTSAYPVVQTSSGSSVSSTASRHTETLTAHFKQHIPWHCVWFRRVRMLFSWWAPIFFFFVPQHAVQLWAACCTSDTSDTEGGSLSLRTSSSQLHTRKK